MNQQLRRQQMLDFNQMFQDSMMVINSTRMKLNDPRDKEKRNALPAMGVAISGSNTIAIHHNTDSNFHFRKKHSQKISVEVTNKQDGRIQQFDSEGTINVDNN